MSLALRQVGFESLAFWRDRRRAVMTFLFPLLMLLLFGSLSSGNEIDSRGGISFVSFFVPGIVAYGVVTTTFSNLSVSLAAAKEHGVLKRIKGTPLPFWAFFAGRAGSALVVCGAMTLVTLVLGAALFGVDVRLHTLPAFLAAEALGALTFTALGIAVARLLPSADSAGPVQAAIVFPVAFVSGIWFPLDDAPGWLDALSKALPLRPLADALQVAFDPRTAGSGFVGHDLLALAIWSLVGARLAIGFLRATSARD